MDQLATKGKNCKSTVCTFSEDSDPNGSDGCGDFVDCEKCGVSIHKICFKLSGDLLKIFQDFERRNEKFPFTILCSECRQFTDTNNEVQLVDSCEESDSSKNPFDIDCIVKVIVDHLNIQDLVNVRLVNKLWNQNACIILSKESRQVQLKAYHVRRNRQGLEDCLQIVKSSDQTKLMQKWEFELDTVQGQDLNNSNDINMFNQIITNTKPTSVTIWQYGKVNLEGNNLFSTFLSNISENVVDLSLNCFEEITDFHQTQLFCMPKFSKLKSLRAHVSSENYEFVKMIIENSPNLMKLSLCDHTEDLAIDDYNTEKSTHRLLTEKSTRNLQILKLVWTDFNFETFEMKLKTLFLHADYYYPQSLKFAKLKTFLISQNDSLENLKMYFPIQELLPMDEIDDLENAQVKLPRLENVQHFSLTFQLDGDEYIVHNPDKEIWPVKPINLAGKLPNLKKISIAYCENWALSFETEQKCSSVTELVLKKWTDGDLTELVELFPRVEVLNLKGFRFNTKYDGVKIYTQLDNLNGWSESLKRIEISCEHYHLENLDFEKLVCLTNLESIKISKINGQGPDRISSYFIYPDFKPLFKIATLSQVAINNFKISKGIVEDLREKYPSLDYSFYPKF